MAPFRFFKGALAVLVIVCFLAVAGPALALETRPQGIGPKPPAPTGILLNLPARTLYWYVGGELVRSFPVGIGKVSSQTPVGSYRIQNKAVHPWWLPPWGGPVVPPGPDNPLGTRWMAFDGSYGIHGNNNPPSIGGVVSAGCVRMYIPDVEWLYEQVAIGTPVNVVYYPMQIHYGPGGRRYLAIDQDVYGWGSPSVNKVLAAAEIEAGAVATSEPGLYALDAGASVNGRSLDAIMHGGKPYLAARALGQYLFAKVGWDPERSQVSLDGLALPTVLRGGTGYVDAASATASLGVDYHWDSGSTRATVTGRPLFLNGHLQARSGKEVDGALYFQS